MDKQAKCETCVFFDDIKLDGGGICRCNPPNGSGEWSKTHPADWCGKWELDAEKAERVWVVSKKSK